MQWRKMVSQMVLFKLRSEGAQGSNTMKSITLDALQKEAKKRPTAAEVHSRLEEVMVEMLFWIKEAPAYYCKIS